MHIVDPGSLSPKVIGSIVVAGTLFACAIAAFIGWIVWRGRRTKRSGTTKPAKRQPRQGSGRRSKR